MEAAMSVAAGVDPERLLKQLRALWRDLGKQDANGVLRACAMTLIVVIDEALDASIVGETIATLMHEHPSRAIVIRVRQCPEEMLEARVFAQCWMPFGRRQQICCEQVEIIASDKSLADVASVVRGLIVPDLPSILFSPSENLWWLPQFKELLPLATKLIVDSCGMHDSARVLEWWNAANRVLDQHADLVWSRLTPWRQAVARIFEGRARISAVRGVQSVELRYVAADTPSAVLYLAGWFRAVLGEQVEVSVSATEGPEYAGISSVTLHGPGLEASVGLLERNTAETRVNGESFEVTVFPVANDVYALRQELSVPGRDPVFEKAVRFAERMRQST
jgi:glucose-6-phosphate dehydrogenase assembly protein OpcA